MDTSVLEDDLVAGCVVFLVALPLCLGVALASGAPLFGGIIAAGSRVTIDASGSAAIVIPILGFAKLRAGQRLENRALIADSKAIPGWMAPSRLKPRLLRAAPARSSAGSRARKKCIPHTAGRTSPLRTGW